MKHNRECLFAYASKLSLPDYIVQELQEQVVFMSERKIVKMLSWERQQFLDWYNEEI